MLKNSVHLPKLDKLLLDKSKCSKVVKTANSPTAERWLLDRSNIHKFKHLDMEPSERIPAY